MQSNLAILLIIIVAFVNADRRFGANIERPKNCGDPWDLKFQVADQKPICHPGPVQLQWGHDRVQGNSFRGEMDRQNFGRIKVWDGHDCDGTLVYITTDAVQPRTCRCRSVAITHSGQTYLSVGIGIDGKSKCIDTSSFEDVFLDEKEDLD